MTYLALTVDLSAPSACMYCVAIMPNRCNLSQSDMPINAGLFPGVTFLCIIVIQHAPGCCIHELYTFLIYFVIYRLVRI